MNIRMKLNMGMLIRGGLETMWYELSPQPCAFWRWSAQAQALVSEHLTPVGGAPWEGWEGGTSLQEVDDRVWALWFLSLAQLPAHPPLDCTPPPVPACMPSQLHELPPGNTRPNEPFFLVPCQAFSQGNEKMTWNTHFSLSAWIRGLSTYVTVL